MEAGKEESVGPATVRQRFLSHLRPRVHVSIPITTRGTARGAAIKQYDRPIRGQSLRATPARWLGIAANNWFYRAWYLICLNATCGASRISGTALSTVKAIIDPLERRDTFVLIRDSIRGESWSFSRRVAQ